MADSAAATAWRWGDYLLLPVQRQLLHGGRPIEIEDRVFDLLVLLLQSREHGLSRQVVTGAIWGKRPVNDATLRQLVYKARRAVGDDGEHQSIIRTLYGRSLQWVAPVEVVPVPGAGSIDPVMAQPTVGVAATPESPGAASPGAGAPDEPDEPSAADDAARHVAAPRRGITVHKRVWLVAALVLVAGSATVLWTLPHPQQGRVAALAAATSGTAPATPTTQATTLAVLPFVDLDPAQDHRYVGDGLAEELINRLARMPRLRVTARTSSFAFRGQRVEVREVARQLGVSKVLEGSVQRTGERWRVRVALVDAGNGFQLWANEYDAPAGNLLDMEDDIAGAVIATLYPELQAPAVASSRGKAQVDPLAHDEYLVGLEYLNRRTRADLEQAIAHFRRAVAAAPAYAEAWTRLAEAYAVWSDYDSDSPPDTHYADALDAVRRAIALDSRLAHAHAVLGLLRMEHWQWQPAVVEYQRALQLDPSDAAAHHWYAMYLWYQGNPDAALVQMRLANRLDPLSPSINGGLGRALLYAGHRDQAVAQYRHTLVLAPRFPLAHILLAEAYMAQGRYVVALDETRRAIALAPTPTPSSDVAMLGVALSLAGDQQGARSQLAILRAYGRKHYVSGVSVAFLAAQLGLHDQVFDALFQAVAAHDPLLQPAISDHDAWWYTDPRMVELRSRMGLSDTPASPTSDRQGDDKATGTNAPQVIKPR